MHFQHHLQTLAGYRINNEHETNSDSLIRKIKLKHGLYCSRPQVIKGPMFLKTYVICFLLVVFIANRNGKWKLLNNNEASLYTEFKQKVGCG